MDVATKFLLSSPTTSKRNLLKMQRAIKSWKENIQPFVDKWGGWIGVVILLVYVVFFTSASYHFQAFGEGVKMGFGTGAKINFLSNPLRLLKFIAIVIIVLTILFAMVAAVGWLHYTLIYKPLIKKNNIGYIIFYITFSLILYTELGSLLKKIPKFTDSPGTVAIAFWIFGMLFSIIADFLNNKKTQQKLIQERTQAELGALKAQVNPHFLFNTLNNLYGTALIEDSPKTAEGINQLANIMRHVVEGTSHDQTSIEKELKFLGDYIELQKMRIPNRPNIQIKTSIEWDEKPAEIAPLVMIPFIENAFKYGISISQDCFINVAVAVENQHLTMHLANTILNNKAFEKSTGTGIENARKRLQLLYPNKHQLQISENNKVFSVQLSIEL